MARELTPNTPNPQFLLPAHYARDILHGVAPTTFKPAFRMLHRLVLPSGTTMFPGAYVHAFARVYTPQGRGSRNGLAQQAGEFAQTPEAHILITRAEAWLNASLAENTDSETGLITAQRFTSILDIGRMAVNDWAKSGAIPQSALVQGERTGRAAAPVYVIASAMGIYWERPETYDPSRFATDGPASG